MTPNRYTLFFLLLFFHFTVSIAQDIAGESLSKSYEQVPLVSLLNDFSITYGVTLYFDENELPDRPLSIELKNSSLEEALTKALAGTDLGFLNYRNYVYIIGKKEELERSYDAAFFSAVENMLNAPEEETNILTFSAGTPTDISPTGTATVSGKVNDNQTGEAIIGATISFPELDAGTITDFDGRFSLELPIGKHKIVIAYLGYSTLSTQLNVYNSDSIKVPLESASFILGEVVVEAETPDENVQSAAVGITKLKLEEIRKLPTFLGEIDVVRSLLQQPGVSNAGEGSSGFNVRGGNVDQNLVLLNEHFVFNTSHALGFFSAFNSDLIQSVTLYKGHIPAQYGGRLSSVLDVDLKDGSQELFRIKGGIGLVSSRISMEGPIFNKKGTYVAGFRTTYSDWLLNLINIPEVQNSAASFYDANLKYIHRFNDNHQVAASFYNASDNLNFNDEFGFDYQTLGGQISYKAVISPKLLSDFTLVGSQYEATGTQSSDVVNASSLFTQYQYWKAKETLTWVPNDNLNVKAGFSSIFYQIQPGQQRPLNDQSVITPVFLEDEQALESALFTNMEWKINERITTNLGLRYSIYQYLGPKTYFNYSTPEQPSNESIIGSQTAGNWETIQHYQTLEPRFALRYLLDSKSSIKLGYSRTAQYINQLANLVTPTPVSIWQLSNQYILPSRAHNGSLGYFRNFGENNWETSIEAYYRHIDQLTDFKDFAVLTSNPNIETELLRGTGRAYGTELSIKKKEGKLNGWLSYTFSRTEQQVEEINNGVFYPAYYDKPHDFTMVANWQMTGRVNLAFNFNYSTGRPITAPVGKYTAGGKYSILEFSERNQVRIPDYHRLDLALTLDRNYKKTQKLKYNWTVSIYNLYARKNVYSVFFEPTTGLPKTLRLSVLGSTFVSLSINFFYQ